MTDELRPGYSADGYIIDQTKMGAHPYGRFRSDWNGCGWIAVYDLLRAMGIAATENEVRAALDDILPWGGFFGTPVRTMRRYLASLGVNTRVTEKKDPAMRACASAEYGILRYFCGDYAHYVTFIRQRGGGYRFLNTSDDEPDFCAGMPLFFRKYVKLHYAKAIIPAAGDPD